MLTSIFFLFTFLLCFTSILLLPKTSESVSFIRSMVVCYIAVICLGALFAFPLSLFSIPINLVSMALIYLLLSVCFFFYCFQKKQTQSYFFDYFDLITALLLFFVVLVVIWRVFSFQLNLNYYNSDPGVHFMYAMQIVRTEDLGRMYFAPLYNALFIEMLEPFFSGIYAYKAFIFADSFSNYIAGMMFYVLIASDCKSTKIRKLSPIITLLYFAGWPLYNYVLGGFVYWGIGVTLIAFGIYLLRLYSKYKEKQIPIILLLLLALYNIAICYMLFVPYAAVLFVVALIAFSWEKIKQISKRLLIGIVIGTLTICIFIFLFAFFTYFNGDTKKMFSALSTDGGIHLSFYRDFIFFLPFIAYACGKFKKIKVFRFNMFILGLYALTVLGSLGLCVTGIMSVYYFYKLYYLLWLLLWLVTTDAISYILEESHAWFTGYLVMLAFMFGYTFTPIEDYFIEKGLMNYAYSEFPLYSANGSYVKSPTPTRYDDSFWEIITYVTERKEFNQTPLIGAPYDYIYLYWYEAITGYKCEYIKTDVDFNEYFIENAYSENPSFVVMKSCEYYEDHKNDLSSYPIIFENEFAVIYTGK